MPKRVLIFLFSGLLFYLQAGWIKTYCPHDASFGDFVENTPDGGYIAAGWDYQAAGYIQRLYIVKTDSLGDTLWTRTYDGTQDCGGGRCVRNAEDSGYVILGVRGVDWNSWLLRIDPRGDTMWTRPLLGNDSRFFLKTDDGYLITGSLLLKVDFEGNELWSKPYEAGSDLVAGSAAHETPDGGYIITGVGGASPDYGLGILRTDSAGMKLWSKLYKFGDPSVVDEGHAIEPTSDGGWIITGAAEYEVARKGCLVLMKIDSVGDSLWTKFYDYGGGVENGKAVVEVSDGGFIVLAQKNYSMFTEKGSIWILKTDFKGDTLWTRTYGGKFFDSGNSLQLTPDGGFIITGFTESFSSDTLKHLAQLLLMKLDSLGLLGVTEGPLVYALSKWELSNPLGKEVTLRYSNFPHGFHACIYDASGRKVDELSTPNQSGVLVWGSSQRPGVYFIVPQGEKARPSKVVLVR